MLFFNKLTMKKSTKTRRLRDHLLLLAAILTQFWRPVASSEALDLLHWVMCAVTYRRIAMAIKTASKVGVCFCLFFI
jgi:hypothetical protein